jgi:hypothetical protein
MVIAEEFTDNHEKHAENNAICHHLERKVVFDGSLIWRKRQNATESAAAVLTSSWQRHSTFLDLSFLTSVPFLLELLSSDLDRL